MKAKIEFENSEAKFEIPVSKILAHLDITQEQFEAAVQRVIREV